MCSTYSSLPFTKPQEPLSLHCLHSFTFFLYHVIGIIQYVAFQDWLLLLNVHLEFLILLHDWTAHFSLVLIPITLSACTMVYLCTHLLKDILLGFGNYEKAIMNILVFLWTEVFNSFGYILGTSLYF